MKSVAFQEDLQVISAYLKEKQFSGSTILVTGATGLIGSIIIKGIVEYNKENEEKIHCIGLARNPEKVKTVFHEELDANGLIPNVSFLYQDIEKTIPESIKCDFIIHTANSTTSKFFMTNPVEVIDSIYIGSKNVFEFARQSNVKGIVYLSSMEVFGQVFEEKRACEKDLGYIDLQNVRSCYSEGKRLVECLAASYAHEYGLPVKVVRLAQTFGAGVPSTENRVFAQFARAALNGENIVLHTKGLSLGNYCYTTDVIRAILLLLKTGENGDVYTVVNEETTQSIYDMACMVAENFSNGKSKVVFDIPKNNEFGYAPYTRLKLSSAKINSLGWDAKYNLKEMFERMIPDLKE